MSNPDAYYQKRIKVRFQQWRISDAYPIGTFMEDLGPIGDKDTEAKVILLEHNVEFRPFSKQVLGTYIYKTFHYGLFD